MTLARPKSGRAVILPARPQPNRQLGLTEPMWRPRHINRCLAADIRTAAAQSCQDDWLPRYQRASGVHHRPLPAEAYRPYQPWVSRSHFLEHVVPWAIERYRDVLRRYNSLSPATFQRWAETETLYADRRTGRDVICRPGAHGVADLAEMSERTVQYCRAAAKEMGIYADLQPGRMLAWSERCQARAAGSRQRGLSTVSLFCLPQAYLDHLRICTPPRGSSVGKSSAVMRSCEPRSAKKKEPAQAPAQPRRKRRSPAGLGLAIALIQRLPWLTSRTTETAPGRIAALLTRYVTCTYPWTAQLLMDRMTAVNRRLNYSAPENARCAVALLAWYVHQIDPYGDHPLVQRDIARDARRRKEGERKTQAFHERVQRQIEAEQASTRAGEWVAKIRANLANRRDTTADIRSE